MKSKTIKAVLRKKFDEFAKSIKDEEVRKLVKKNSIITGGSIASMLLKEEVNDYDIYFTNRETVLAVCNYYCKQFNERNGSHAFIVLDGTIPEHEFNWDFWEGDKKEQSKWYADNVTKGRIKIRVRSAGIAEEPEDEYEIDDSIFSNDADAVVEDGGSAPDVEVSMVGEESTPDPEKIDMYRPVYISANAITLADDVQLIIRFFGNAKEIHKNYDFEHCKCWWRSSDSKLKLPSKSLVCLLGRDLVYSGSKYPLASIIRSRKFINRGFTINAGQYLKMCMELNELDLRDLKVLEDQLTGVDAFWFAKMLSCLDNDKLKEDIDNTYVFELIDRFF